MGKFVGFIICVIIGTAIIALSIINENFYCSRADNSCLIQSKLGIFNIILSEDKFLPSEINKAYCETQLQPARSGGKKKFFILKIELNTDKEYSLGSYRKYANCKSFMDKINDFKKQKIDELSHGSGLGYSNTFGIMLGIIVFMIGYLILTSKEEEKKYDWEEEDDDEKE